MTQKCISGVTWSRTSSSGSRSSAASPPVTTKPMPASPPPSISSGRCLLSDECLHTLRRRRSPLLERVGAGERIELLAGLRDAGEVRERRDVDAEELGPGGLAGKADVGERHLVAMAEATCFACAEVNF